MVNYMIMKINKENFLCHAICHLGLFALPTLFRVQQAPKILVSLCFFVLPSWALVRSACSLCLCLVSLPDIIIFHNLSVVDTSAIHEKSNLCSSGLVSTFLVFRTRYRAQTQTPICLGCVRKFGFECSRVLSREWA